MPQYSTDIRNAKLDQVDEVIGDSAVLKIFSGEKPENCAAPDPSGLLVTIILPVEWMNNSVDGVKTMRGEWTASASGAGAAASYRIYPAESANCKMQGDATEMVFDNENIKQGQVVSVKAFTLKAGNK